MRGEDVEPLAPGERAAVKEDARIVRGGFAMRMSPHGAFRRRSAVTDDGGDVTGTFRVMREP
jgi:hypothetical protein